MSTDTIFHHDDKPFNKQLKQVCAISVDLKLIAHKTWNVIKRKFFIFHFNKIGKIKGIYRGHKINHKDGNQGWYSLTQCRGGGGVFAASLYTRIHKASVA